MFGITANVISDPALRDGAKVWVCRCDGSAVSPWVIGMAKGGRRIRKYTRFKRLTNFRAAWIPDVLRDEVKWQWKEKSEAADFARRLSSLWADVRFFSKNGETLLKHGIPTEEAFRRLEMESRNPDD